MATVHWDKAVRGRAIESIWELALMPMIGVYDKTGKTTETVPLGKKSINGLATEVFAHRGAISIRGVDGEFIPLTGKKLTYQPNADGTWRPYCDYLVPENSNCDIRLWGGTFTHRMTSRRDSSVVYGEHIRAHAPGSAEWNALYGARSLAETVNSWMKDQLLPGQRARSLNQRHQWIDLMLILMLRNDRSLMLYRRRTRATLTASPPAA